MKARLFVISLEGAHQRREEFSNRAKTTATWQFVDASTELDPGLRYDPVEALRRGGRSLTTAELGCYSSHFRLWRALIEDAEADRYLILEDDVVVDWPFLERLLADRGASDRWPLLRLFFTVPVPTRKVFGPFFETYQVVELLGHGYGAVAYLIHKQAALKLIAALADVVAPVDLAMEQGWRLGVRNLAVFPFPVLHPMGLSQIGGARYGDAPKPLAMKAGRGLRRVGDAARRMVWHWRGRAR